jgi:hypothetical protein
MGFLLLPFHREAGLRPVLFPPGVVADFGVTQRRQFTGGVLGRVSSEAAAIDHNLRVLVGEELGCELPQLAGRNVHRSR